MKVQQLLEVLQGMPLEATVLLEGDAGYSPLGEVSLQTGSGGMPDEVIFHPDMTPD